MVLKWNAEVKKANKKKTYETVKKKTHISWKRDEVRSGDIYAKVLVQLLFKQHLPILWKTEGQLNT